MSNLTFVTHRFARKTQWLALVLGLAVTPAFLLLAWQRTADHNTENTAPLTAARVQENYGKVPLHFEANQGQYQRQVKYLTRGKGYSIALTPQAAVIELQNERAARVEMKLKGANAAPRMTSAEPLATKMNYFIGNDPKQWKTDVPTFAKVKYEQVYPGTDVIYYGNQQQLEYDFIVAPQADPSAIKLEFTGVNAMRVDDAGNLLLATDAGEVKQHKPILYQEVAGQRREIAGSYRLAENEVGFAIGEYDRSLPLVIDPVIAYATFINGANDFGNAIAVDANGNAYIAGHVDTKVSNASAGAINVGTSGAPRGEFAYVAKFNSTGTNLVYQAVIGGITQAIDPLTSRLMNLGNRPFGIAVDAQGNAYVSGWTISADFPTTPGAVQPTYAPQANTPEGAFVIKLNPTGNRLVYSTLLGNGSGAVAIAVDGAGQAVVTGYNYGTMPLKDAFQSTYAGLGDAFVTKLNATGTGVIFSTLMGSASVDRGQAVTLDQAGNIYIKGDTGNGWDRGSSGERIWGKRFPTSQGAFLTSEGESFLGGNFIAKFEPTGSLVYSTVWPGEWSSNKSHTPSIAVDAAGCVYFSSFASSDSYPTTPESYQPTYINGATPGALTKLNANGSSVVYSTFLAGSVSEGHPGGMTIDAEGNAYVAIKTGQILKMNAQGNQLLYSVNVPGTSILGLAIDSARNVYITGTTRAGAGFTTTPGAYQPRSADLNKVGAFVAKISETAPPASPAAYSIRGTVSLRSGQGASDGVKVMLQGNVNRTTITDSSGNYLFDLLPAGGNYTVAPDAANYLALPGAANVNNLSAHQVLNFEVANKEARYVSHVSAANYATGPLANESIVSAFGTNLTPLTQRATEFPLPREMGGTKVRVKDSAGMEKYAELLFISPTQVNYVLPSGLALGSALVTVTSPDGTTSKEVMILETTTPGLFTADASGRGLAAANVQRVKADGTQKTEDIVTFDPIRGRMMAVPIDLGAIDDKVYLTLYGTGVRHRLSLTNVRATVGGVASTVSYAGSQNHFAGLDQINVLIPRELAGRGEVEVTLTVDGRPANTVRVKIK